MRGVWACLGAIAALLVLSAPVAGKPRPRADALTSAAQSSPSDRATGSRNGSSQKGSSEKGSSESDSSQDGSSQNGSSSQSENDQQSSSDEDEPDTADIFGFTDGTDTSAKGTRVLWHDVVGRLGRRDDSAGALRGSIGVSYSPSDRLQVSIGGLSDYQQSGGDPLLNELRGALGFGLAGIAKYRVLEREKDSLVGLAVQAAPFFRRSLEVTGGESDLYGVEFRVMADYEFVPKQLFGALNFVYRPQGHTFADGTSATTSILEASAAVSSRLKNDIYLGAEARYVAQYDGAFFNDFSGWALYVGPTFYASLSENAYIGFAWNVQVASSSEADVPLDIAEFGRHQFRIKSGIVF